MNEQQLNMLIEHVKKQVLRNVLEGAMLYFKDYDFVLNPQGVQGFVNQLASPEKVAETLSQILPRGKSAQDK